MKLSVSHTARKDLREIFRYTRKKWDIEQAVTYTEELWDEFELIRSGQSDRKVKIILDCPSVNYRKHRIFYAQVENRVIITRVLHVSMDFERHLPPLD